MNKRSRRKMMVVMVMFGVAVSTVLALTAFDENLMYFYSPTQIKAGEAPESRAFRAGGLVVTGSVNREKGSLAVTFSLTDNAETIDVSYSGILPDLFREGQGIVALGSMKNGDVFIADEVLAKHDENYMPPEVADSLEASGQKMPEGMGM
jgi:cytochrome c-type biogenesis protein CcmE